jgi:hypothetical protein
MNTAALSHYRRCITENGLQFKGVPWSASHHRPVWVEVGLDDIVPGTCSLPYLRAPPRSNWAALPIAERDAVIEAAMSFLLKKVIRKLESSRLDSWGGSIEEALKEIIPLVLKAETAAIGRSKTPRMPSARRSPKPPQWWTSDLTLAEERRSSAAAQLARAAYSGDADSAMAATEEMKAARSHFDSLRRRAYADYLQGRYRAARGDYRVERAVHDEVTSGLGIAGSGCATGVQRWSAMRHPQHPNDGPVISCDLVAPVISAAIKASFEDDIDATAYSRQATIERRSLFAELQRKVSKECRTGSAAAAERGRDPETWRRQVLKGEIFCDLSLPRSQQDALAFSAATVRVPEVSRAARKKKPGTSPSPLDGISAELIKYGGPTFHKLLALLFDIILRDPKKHTPRAWRVACRRDLYKGKDRDPLSWLSYRGIALMSNLMKCYEGVLLGRMEVISQVDELQAVGNRGIDTRMQLHLVLDVIAERAAKGLPTWLIPVDLTRGFPSTERESAGLALHEEGVRGVVLRAWMELVFDTSVRIGITPHQFTEAVSLATGLFEGAVLSPRGFAAHTGSLIRKLRDSGLGVSFGEEWCGSPMLMDDLILIPKDESEVEPMINIVMEWCYEFRMVVAMDKTKICLINDHLAPAASTCFLWRWVPPLSLEDNRQRRRSGSHTLIFDVKTGNVKYLGYVLGASPEHVKSQLDKTRAAVARIENSSEDRRGLKLNQAMWAWTVYARHFAEWPSAVWPLESASRSAAFEFCQVRALVGLLGSAVPRGLFRGKVAHVNPGRALVLSVFDLWELSERRLLGRLRYSAACTLSMMRPTRSSFGDHADFLLESPTSDVYDKETFLKLSPSAAIATAQEVAKAARMIYGAGSEEDSDEDSAAGDGGSDDGSGGCMTSPSEEEGAEDDVLPLDEDDASASRVSTNASMEVDDSDEHSSVSDSEEEKEEEEAAAVDGFDDPLKAARHTLGGEARRLVKAIARGNRVAHLKQLKAPAALYKALDPSQAWLKEVAREQELDGALAAFVALLIGSWWAAPAVRLPGQFKKGVCGACGCGGDNLAVHLVLGASGGVPCTGAAVVRRAFLKKASELFSAAGRLQLLKATPSGSMQRLAMLLGNGGNKLPAKLARALPKVFCETFGRWSAEHAPSTPSLSADDDDSSDASVDDFDDYDDDDDDDDDDAEEEADSRDGAGSTEESAEIDRTDNSDDSSEDEGVQNMDIS